ncbi:MAG: polysaccharide deacetylase family protein [Candidatus Marinimicrobia bacterium]|nr:polysaccharide deacetylase family protein [Candidatus Neomarinimicrobiota bacterium]
MTTTTPKQLKAQMQKLKQLGFSFSTIRDHDPGQQEVLVTFDDGYASIKRYAAPALAEVGGVGTVFAITDYVGQKNSWDYFPEHKQVQHMSWRDLRELHDQGWEIGSHGRSHRRMINMDLADIRSELVTSKKQIEDQIGQEVVTFCPPFNAWNGDLLHLIEEAGYWRIAISYPLTGLPSWSGEFVPRLGVYLHDMLPLFLAKIMVNPLAPVAVLQQQLINLAGDGKIVENWLNPTGK